MTDFFEASAELIQLANAEHVPPRIKLAVSRLGECEKKLFCWVPECDSATVNAGTPVSGSGFQPSDFLRELVLAARAFDWPKVLILIHGEIPSIPTSVD